MIVGNICFGPESITVDTVCDRICGITGNNILYYGVLYLSAARILRKIGKFPRPAIGSCHSLNLTVNSNTVNSKKTIKFKDAYCVRLYEYFNNNNSVQMYLKLSIMAGSVKFGDNCEFVLIDK